ncbi:hypothetical protein M409DRAFT_49171 [Zasmidium cellare ATCC 36951]|uniref:Enoyl reductase (ER) domain-containing protein n=1 Tax=Zasmidium cellare ATCC 36951 TaxID=1080233 RepID=A0A6A6D4P6_ZASCE|nr:uncharacterized protein M409DRAFT_49171 [Zasmidium cellare ATCC 36951]KAF2172616.1 hypothetical protein M409DRAFT_49171 [Zasmidium cellare ATCC 36951]
MFEPSNSAAFLVAANQRPLAVKPALYPTARPYDVIVRNKAVAINPVERAKQEMGDMMFPWLKYPIILGNDVAGEVVEVGSCVDRFKPGDRVVGHAMGMSKESNNPAEGAFQNFTVLFEHMTSPIPDSVTFEQAAVMPLAVSTAACGFYQDDQLKLELPTTDTTPGSRGEILIVWGGATSVGCNAIQLGVASGYTVFTTCSPRNSDLMYKLGASEVFDYNDPNIKHTLLKAINDRPIAGGLSLGRGGAETMMDVFPKCKGNKFIACGNYPEPHPAPKNMVMLRIICKFLSWQISMWWKGMTRGIGWKFIFADTLTNNGVGKAVYTDYLPKALADKSYVPAPEPIVFGHGLDVIQEAFDYQARGVSAKKVVVTL